MRMGNIPMAAIIATKTKPPATPLVTQVILWHCIVQPNNWANAVPLGAGWVTLGYALWSERSVTVQQPARVR